MYVRRSLVGLGGGSKPCGKVTVLTPCTDLDLGVTCGCLVDGGGGCLGSQLGQETIELANKYVHEKV